MLFANALLTLAALGGAMTVTGRLACAVIGPRWLRRPTAENWALAALAGTAVWAMLSAWAMYLGARAPQAALVVAGGCALLLLGAAWRGRLGWLRPSFRGASLGLGLVAALGASLALLSLLLSDGFWLYSDAPTYVGIAGWLQEHGYWEPWQRPDRPGLAIFAGYMGPRPPGSVLVGAGLKPVIPTPDTLQCLRMWAQFLYATCVAAVPGGDAFRMLLPVAAWGLVLNLAGVFLLCRWGLRLTRPWAGAAVFLAAALMNPLHFSAGGGYLPQLFGTACLATYVAVLCRAQAPCRWTTGTAAVLGLLVAALIGFYSEMAPLMVLLSAPVLARLGWRAARAGRTVAFARFVAATLAAVFVLGNYDIDRGLRAVRGQTKTYDVARVEWPRVQFLSFALGTYPMNPAGLPPGNLAPAHWALAAAAAGAALVGLRALAGRRAFPAAAAAAVFVTMGLYFSLVARDPWNGTLGHTWNVWKTCKWAYPVTVVVVAAGLARLFGPRPSAWALGAGAAAVLAVAVPVHVAYGRLVGTATRSNFGTDSVLREWPAFREAVRASGAEEVALVQGPLDGTGDLFALFYTPGEFTQFRAPEPAGTDRPKRLYVGWNSRPFDADRQRLPGGFVPVDLDRPQVLKAHAPFGTEQNRAGETFVWLGSERALLEVWVPAAGTYRLSMSAAAAPGETAPSEPRLTVRGPDKALRECPLGRGDVSAELDLPAGFSVVELACPTPGDLPPSAGVAARGAWAARVRLERRP